MRTVSVRILFHGREPHTNRGEKFLVVEWLVEECGCASIQRGGTDQRVFLSGKDDHPVEGEISRSRDCTSRPFMIGIQTSITAIGGR